VTTETGPDRRPLYQLSAAQLRARPGFDRLDYSAFSDDGELLDVFRFDHGERLQPGPARLVIGGSAEVWRGRRRTAICEVGHVTPGGHAEVRARGAVEVVAWSADGDAGRTVIESNVHLGGAAAVASACVRLLPLGGGRVLIQRQDPQVGPSDATIRGRSERAGSHRIDGADATILCEPLGDGTRRVLVRTADGPEVDVLYRPLPDTHPLRRLAEGSVGRGLRGRLQGLTGALADPLTPPLSRLLGSLSTLTLGRAQVLELVGEPGPRFGLRIATRG